jgi:ABC-type antimicrobial peptide transport system ATPase subunit
MLWMRCFRLDPERILAMRYLDFVATHAAFAKCFPASLSASLRPCVSLSPFLCVNVSVCKCVFEPGCGKSTMVHLILRFYDPCAGRIVLDGLPLTVSVLVPQTPNPKP